MPGPMQGELTARGKSNHACVHKASSCGCVGVHAARRAGVIARCAMAGQTSTACARSIRVSEAATNARKSDNLHILELVVLQRVPVVHVPARIGPKYAGNADHEGQVAKPSWIRVVPACAECLEDASKPKEKATADQRPRYYRVAVHEPEARHDHDEHCHAPWYEYVNEDRERVEAKPGILVEDRTSAVLAFFEQGLLLRKVVHISLHETLMRQVG
mmetsp:Transcript_4010/g.9358  ORF Transcript_4010/g.9358 Transcript_4010/m.9358 type:complete len:216 (+) Transcript_4010:1037-1684(+)